MFILTVLGSGSAGNCAVLRTGNCTLLIDGGLSARQIVRRLEQAGGSPDRLDGILLTHEHIDHVCGLEVFCRKWSVPVYCNALTAAALRSREDLVRKDWRLFTTGRDFSIGDITVEPFSVPHDAMDPVGFVFHCGTASVGYLTDLGVATRLVMERVRRVSTLVLEANHDEKMLQEDTRRPWPVKQRIMSRHGHLSNQAAAEVAARLPELRRIVLGHLSRDCNAPELALETVRRAVSGSGAELYCATQREVTPSWEIP